ncbi:MAG: hypothetical protein GX620_00330 [Chloroflexi bacterium]|nr:hypothetical protein [Chloroflexota bacterium]
MRLSREAFNRARGFIFTHAREVDMRLFEYYFERGSAEAVLNALAHYQNDDGGFGHGLEPDFRLSASSPMATSVALQYCVEVEAGLQSEILKGAIDYLVASYDGENGYWPFAPLEVNEEPHAPWWHASAVTPPTEPRWSNPSAELAGYILRYADLAPRAFVAGITERIRRNLQVIDRVDGLYNMMCWQRAVPAFPPDLVELVEARVSAGLEALRPISQNTLGEIRIFWLVPRPDVLCASLIPEVVDDLLAAEIGRQAKDGGWWPTWDWGQYEDAWQVARVEWAGRKTVECLRALSLFKRIE